MPTMKQIKETYGEKRCNQMVNTGLLTGITVKIVRARCVCKCEKCGRTIKKCIDPFDWNTQISCDCGRWKGLHIEKIDKMDADFPQSDIDCAYRASMGEKILGWD